MKQIFSIAVAALLFSQVSAQADLKQVDKYLSQMQKEWNVPSMTVGIVKDGELVFSKGYGVKKVGENEKPNGNTLYAVASNSKAFTSAAIALLVQQGKLDWDDKVVDHVPYFELYDEYVTAQTTIRDLLSHRVGLATFSGDIIWYRSTLTSEEVVRRLKYLPQAFDFRSGFGYSNVMYVTAGEVIKAVSGQTWDEFVKENFLDVLGMDRSITSIRQLENTDNYATPHAVVDGENVPIAWTNWDAVAPTGGLISSVNDMAQWVIFNLNNGIWKGDTILTNTSRNIMWTLHNVYPTDYTDEDFATHFRGYGLGWGLSDYHGHLRVGHSGGYDGMITYVQMIPDEDLGVIVLTNGMKSPIVAAANYVIDAYLELPEEDYSKQMLERLELYGKMDTRIQERKEARIPDTKPTLPLENYTGTYYADIYGNISVSQEGDNLAISFEHSPDFEATLTHWHHDVFSIEWKQPLAWFSFGTVKFNLNHQLDVESLSFDVPNDDIWFHELKPVKRK